LTLVRKGIVHWVKVLVPLLGRKRIVVLSSLRLGVATCMLTEGVHNCNGDQMARGGWGLEVDEEEGSAVRSGWKLVG
jgi:hypothetical protein